MISADQTTLQIGRFTGLLLLLVVSILPLSATVRADDESDKNTGSTQRDAERLERILDETRAVLRSQRDAEKLERILDEIRAILRTQHLRDLSEIRNSQYRKALESLNQKELKTSTQELRNLGFDDQLIRSLVRDREKTQSAINALNVILRVNDENKADTK